MWSCGRTCMVKKSFQRIQALEVTILYIRGETQRASKAFCEPVGGVRSPELGSPVIQPIQMRQAPKRISVQLYIKPFQDIISYT